MRLVWRQRWCWGQFRKQHSTAIFVCVSCNAINHHLSHTHFLAAACATSAYSTTCSPPHSARTPFLRCFFLAPKISLQIRFQFEIRSRQGRRSAGRFVCAQRRGPCDLRSAPGWECSYAACKQFHFSCLIPSYLRPFESTCSIRHSLHPALLKPPRRFLISA